MFGCGVNNSPELVFVLSGGSGEGDGEYIFRLISEGHPICFSVICVYAPDPSSRV